jgi:hypothetical protein
MNKKLDDMTPDEEQEYIDEINDYFCTFIEAAPFVEVGDVPGMQLIKLRSHVHEGYNIGGIIFELQMMLHRYKKNHPEKNVEKLIVSELELTKDVYDPLCFCPLRGVMIHIKYITDENFI